MKTETFDDMIRDFMNGTFDNTNNGKCVQCAECCGSILPMTDKEIETIRKYIKRYNIKPQNHTTGPLAQPILDMTCPFCDAKKDKEKCTIYEVRPKVCRDFSCCPGERPDVDIEHATKCNPVFLRETFYGG